MRSYLLTSISSPATSHDGVRSIAALIINWNGSADTLELLASLCACQRDTLAITAIVIDNASRVEDLRKLQEGTAILRRDMDIALRVNRNNIGVPAAYNQAIQAAGLGHDYYLRLDNDVVIEPAGLLAMVAALERRETEGIAIVGGNIKYFDRRADDNGGAVSIDLVTGKSSVVYPASDVLCDGVLGCIMLLSGRLVNDYAPEVFENALFICTDESELSLRAASEGRRTLYLAQLIGFHKSGRSTGSVSFLANYYSTRNWTLHRLRYVADKRQLIAVLLRIPLDAARSVIRGRWAGLPGLIAGLGLAAAWHLDKRVRRGRA
jgi:GT2 family glycosyltransferase